MWTLITVTNGGDVSHSTGYLSKELCEQAKSVALTGMTIEQNKAADEAYEKSVKEAADRWREAHPPRKPSTPADFKIIEWHKNGSRTLGATDGFSNYDAATGMMLDYPNSRGATSSAYSPNDGESVAYVRGTFVTKHKTDIKYAECVLTDAGKVSQCRAAKLTESGPSARPPQEELGR